MKRAARALYARMAPTTARTTAPLVLYVRWASTLGDTLMLLILMGMVLRVLVKSAQQGLLHWSLAPHAPHAQLVSL